MAVAVRGVRELDRDERLPVGPVVARAGRAELVHQRVADDAGEELVDDQPLVVPGERPPRLVEELRVLDAVLAEPVDQLVVRADEGNLHLAHEDVHVVARVADERCALLVPRHVAVVLEQLCRVVAPVEIGRAGRAASVERLEIRTRRAHVPQRGEIGVLAKRRSIGREVVRDVLAEERPAGRDA